jgi:hypothetical protein
VLLLSLVIERGLLVKEDGGQMGLLGIADSSAFESLQGIASELLGKAGLKEMKDKLQTLQSKQ